MLTKISNKAIDQVLIIDDIPDNIDVIKRIFPRKKYTIHSALTGKQGIELFKKIKPDLVLLDIMMPEMDGYETLNHLRSIEESEHYPLSTPIVFLTAKGNREDIIEGYKSKIDWYVPKPIEDKETFSIIIQNILAKRRAQKQVLIMQQRFMSFIVHDLKSPLSTVMMWFELMLQKDLPLEDIKMRMLKLVPILDKLQHLVDDFLLLSKFNLSEIRLNQKEVQVQTFFKHFLDFNRALTFSKNINTILKNEDDIKSLIIDEMRFSQILQNLYANAVRFTPPNGTITISLKKEHNNVHILIQDSGKGLSDEELSNIWRPKIQKDLTGIGSGFGLLIVKSLVEAHNGQIEVYNEEGKGVIFDIEIPQ